MPIKILGHRGLGPTSRFTSGRFKKLIEHLPPENSLESFQACLEEHGDGIELDVCASKDDVPMVIHNNALNKNVYQANRQSLDLGFISDKTSKHLQSKNTKGHLKYPLGPHSEKISTLNEVLDWMVEENKNRSNKGLDPIILDIELKREGSASAAWKVVQNFLNEKKVFNDDITYCSFKYDQLKEIHELDKKNATFSRKAITIRTQLLYGKEHVCEKGLPVAPHISYQTVGLEKLRQLVYKYKLCALDAEYNDIERDLINIIKDKNLELHCWPSDLGPREPDLVFLQSIFKLENQISTIYIKTDTPKMVKEYLQYYKNEIATIDYSQILFEKLTILEEGQCQNLIKFREKPFASENYVFCFIKGITLDKQPIYLYIVLDADVYTDLQKNKNNSETILDLTGHQEHIIFAKNKKITKKEENQVYSHFAKHYSGKFIEK